MIIIIICFPQDLYRIDCTKKKQLKIQVNELKS